MLGVQKLAFVFIGFTVRWKHLAAPIKIKKAIQLDCLQSFYNPFLFILNYGISFSSPP